MNLAELARDPDTRIRVSDYPLGPAFVDEDPVACAETMKRVLASVCEGACPQCGGRLTPTQARGVVPGRPAQPGFSRGRCDPCDAGYTARPGPRALWTASLGLHATTERALLHGTTARISRSIVPATPWTRR